MAECIKCVTTIVNFRGAVLQLLETEESNFLPKKQKQKTKHHHPSTTIIIHNFENCHKTHIGKDDVQKGLAGKKRNILHRVRNSIKEFSPKKTKKHKNVY